MITIPLHRPWWLRLFWVLTEPASSSRKRFMPRSLHDELSELDERTLRDIGAPDDVLASAHSKREAQRQDHENLRRGVSASGWSTRW